MPPILCLEKAGYDPMGLISTGINRPKATKQTRATASQEFNSDSQLRREVDELKTQFAALSTKVNQQDTRLENLDRKMECNHAEIMAALSNLSLGHSSSSAESGTKRLPELPSTPLKAIAGGKSPKEAKR